MEAPETEELLLVGTVWRAHGVQGEVKIVPETDDPSRFLELDTLFLGAKPGDAAPHEVESARLHQMKKGTVVIVKLEGVDTRDWAETLRSVPVFAREEDLPPLEEGEFFVHDLIGLEAESDEGEPIGTVKNVLTTTGQAVYVIGREGKPDAMVPGVDKFIQEIDVEGGRIVVRPIEGLLD